MGLVARKDSPGRQKLRVYLRSGLAGREVRPRPIRPTNHEPRESWSRPVSRVLSGTIIHLGCASPHTSSGLPGNGADHALVPLFGLAPDGVYPATAVASRAVRSYRTISPLPRKGRCIFCGTFRRLTPPRGYLASCPVEPGLSSREGRLPGRLRSGV